jgi:hypothetical protein
VGKIVRDGPEIMSARMACTNEYGALAGMLVNMNVYSVASKLKTGRRYMDPTG